MTLAYELKKFRVCGLNQSARDDSVDRPITENRLPGRLRVAENFGSHLSHVNVNQSKRRGSIT